MLPEGNYWLKLNKEAGENLTLNFTLQNFSNGDEEVIKTLLRWYHIMALN